MSKKYHDPRQATGKQKVLYMLSKLPDDVSLGEILNRMVLLRKIEIGLEEAEREEGMDHDEFFRELLQENEEGTGVVAAASPKGSPRNQKTHSAKRSENRGKVRPASEGLR